MYQYMNDLADEQAAEEYQKEIKEEIDYVQISYDVYKSYCYYART